jgi:hypothetical protein
MKTAQFKNRYLKKVFFLDSDKSGIGTSFLNTEPQRITLNPHLELTYLSVPMVSDRFNPKDWVN